MMGWSLQKYLEFSLKNLEENREFGLRKKVGTMFVASYTRLTEAFFHQHA